MTARAKLTPAQKRRAAQRLLLASLPVKQHTSLVHVAAAKQKPASGVFASV